MLAVAGCYLTLSAEFLAVAQLLVYAGGIVVLFLFVVMLVEMTKYKEKGLFQVQSPYAVGGGAGRARWSSSACSGGPGSVPAPPRP